MQTGILQRQFALQYRRQQLMATLARTETNASLAIWKLRADREVEERPRLAAASKRIAELARQIESRR